MKIPAIESKILGSNNCLLAQFYSWGLYMLHFYSITKCLKLERLLHLSHLASHTSRFGSTITNHPLNSVLSCHNWGYWSHTPETHVQMAQQSPFLFLEITRSAHLPDHESGISILWWSPFLLWPTHTQTHSQHKQPPQRYSTVSFSPLEAHT